MIMKHLMEKYRDIFHNIKDLKEIKVSTLLLNYLIETQKRDLEHLQMIEETIIKIL